VFGRKGGGGGTEENAGSNELHWVKMCDSIWAKLPLGRLFRRVEGVEKNRTEQ